MPDITPTGDANSRTEMRLKFPLRNIGEYVYRTSRAYRIARNAELRKRSLMRPEKLSPQVQRTLFPQAARAQPSCPQRRSPTKKKQLQAKTTVPHTKTGDITGGAHGGKKAAGSGGEGANGGGGIGEGKSASRSMVHGGDVASAYSENFKKRYGKGRVQKK